MTESITDTLIVVLCKAGCWASQAYDAESSRLVGLNFIVLMTVLVPPSPSSSVSSLESVTNWLSFLNQTMSALGLAFATLQVSVTSSFSRILTRLPGEWSRISMEVGGTENMYSFWLLSNWETDHLPSLYKYKYHTQWKSKIFFLIS